VSRRALNRPVLFAAMAVALLSACHSKPRETAEQKSAAARAQAAVGTSDDLGQALGKSSDLGTMAGFVKDAGLDQALGGIGNYTLFAPTDAAFNQITEDRRKQLAAKENRPRLLAMLRQHIATGYVTPADLTRGLAGNGGAATLATMAGAPIRLHRTGDAILLGQGDAGPRIVGAPITARNGVIYRIDKVIPPAAGGPAAQPTPATGK